MVKPLGIHMVKWTLTYPIVWNEKKRKENSQKRKKNISETELTFIFHAIVETYTIDDYLLYDVIKSQKPPPLSSK